MMATDETILEVVLAVNEAGARHDGIERVKDDGTAAFLEENVEHMREMVGYECRELNGLLKKLYDKYNVEA